MTIGRTAALVLAFALLPGCANQAPKPKVTSPEPPATVQGPSNDAITQFMVAVKFRGPEEVGKQLRQDRRLLGVKDVSGDTGLMKAVATKRHETARTLLENGADVNQGTDGVTALHMAVQFGDDTMVRTLIKYHADTNAATSGFWMIGVSSGHAKGSIGLVELAPGLTPLGLAVYLKRTSIARVLRDAGAVGEDSAREDVHVTFQR